MIENNDNSNKKSKKTIKSKPKEVKTGVVAKKNNPFELLQKSPTPSETTPKNTTVRRAGIRTRDYKTPTELEGTSILPIVPIREGILFPSTESVLTFGRQISLNAITDSVYTQKTIVLVTQKDPNIDEPQPEDLYDIGTLAVVEKTLKVDDNVNALVRGIGRVKILRYLSTSPKLTAEITKLPDLPSSDQEMEALVTHLQKEFRKAVHMGKPVEFLNFMKLMGGVTHGELVDQIASTLNIKTKQKQHILETIDVKSRMKLVIDYLAHEMKVLEIEKDVMHKTQEKFDKTMRENVLRERLKMIQKELGEIEDEEEVMSEYDKKLKKMQLGKALKDKIQKEIKKLRQMSPNNPEAGYVRSWLDTVFELPWNVYTKDNTDIAQASQLLDKEHYGLKEVKDRILEFIAVLEMKKKQEKSEVGHLPTILCFVGPPGVGKTSIGRCIAESMGRKFVKVSLGGVRDEAEIRGHRRTYVGAMAGKIINGMKQAGSMNPIFMLDEIDKLGSDFRGDPSSALLEALDPEQNHGFEDHYIDMPFDLSNVIFVTTANNLATIPPALRDRLEVIEYSGYTAEEKLAIAKQHLLSKVLKANGLSEKNCSISNQYLTKIIARYTREAGVRSLERTLSKIARKIARELTESKRPQQSITLTQKKLIQYLGPEVYDETLTEKEDTVGLATGLAWTSVGGDVLFIEVALSPGKGQVILTGKLGDVMKESAQAAFTYVKSHSKELGIADEILKSTNVHIHVPEGAVPKDGPSAGITITTAIVSAFTRIPIKKEVAMTGEVTLRGRVLRIGGLKEKSIAAQRAGSSVVIIPQENLRDLPDLPKSVTKKIKFITVSDVKDVFGLALRKPLKPTT